MTCDIPLASDICSSVDPRLRLRLPLRLPLPLRPLSTPFALAHPITLTPFDSIRFDAVWSSAVCE